MLGDFTAIFELAGAPPHDAAQDQHLYTPCLSDLAMSAQATSVSRRSKLRSVQALSKTFAKIVEFQLSQSRLNTNLPPLSMIKFRAKQFLLPNIQTANIL